MKNIMGQELLWFPLQLIGIKNSLTGINVNTIIYTWVTIVCLTIVLFLARYALSKNNSIAQYLVESAINPLVDMVEQSYGQFSIRYYFFISSLFIFILSCNWIALIPGISEPTKDLNTTLSLSLITFLYIQKELIRSHGLLNFLKDYFIPFNYFFPLNLLIGILLFPLKFLGEIVGSLSLALRLFGNIFGGYIIMHLFHDVLGESIILNILGIPLGLVIISFFVFFEGFLQSFVFSILALTNITMAVQTENEGDLL